MTIMAKQAFVLGDLGMRLFDHLAVVFVTGVA